MIEDIIAYEQGEPNEVQTITLFQTLIDNGQVWSLQGSYGKMANALINAGICERK